MKSRFIPLLLVLAVFTAACSITPEERSAREKSLKQSADRFIGNVISGDYNSAYNISTKRLAGPQALEEQMKQPWIAGPTLTLGTVSSMSWVGDSAAKVKIVWTFQQGTQQSYSPETTVWVWKGGEWKYDGRTLR